MDNDQGPALMPKRDGHLRGCHLPSCSGCDRQFFALTMPIEERLALALAEDCFTELDEADISNVVAAVLPVIRRYYQPKAGAP